MASDQAKQLLQQGIAAARAGQAAQARQILQESVRRDPRSEAAWLWLSSVAKDAQERAFCLKKVLELNPKNENAIKGLKALGISGPATPTQQPGVPLASSEKIQAAMTELDTFLERYQPVPSAQLPINWVRKRSGLTGSGGGAVLRAGLIGAGLVGAILVFGLIYAGFTVVTGVQVAGLPSVTNSPTATATPTATPGFTNTPSATPEIPNTPTRTLQPPATPGNIYERANTPFYPDGGSGPARTAQAFYAIGQYQTAVPIFATEAKGVELNKGDAKYDVVLYLQVLSLVDSGDAAQAETLLTSYKSETAYYYAALAYHELKTGAYDAAIRNGTLAFEKDSRLVAAIMTVTEAYLNSDQPGKAFDAATRALRDHPFDTNLLVLQGRAALANRDPAEARAAAATALLLDPLNEKGYILNCRAQIAVADQQGDPLRRIQAFGDAVLIAQAYLLQYPGATAAWGCLGSARQGEGNPDAALDAFNQALVVDKTSPAAVDVLIARGNLYLAQRAYPEAFTDFDSALTQNSTIITAHQGRLVASLALDKFSTAQQDLDYLLKLNQNDAGLIAEKAQILVQQGQFGGLAEQLNDGVINALSGAAKASALLSRGIAQFKTGRVGEALADLNASLAVRESGAAHYYRGQIFEQLRNYQAAQIEYQHVAFWGEVYDNNVVKAAATQVVLVATLLPTETLIPTATSTITVTPLPSATQTSTPTNTVTPSVTLRPTNTLIPSATLRPTNTLRPSATPRPSITPRPTLTPRPSATPRVTSTAKS